MRRTWWVLALFAVVGCEDSTAPDEAAVIFRVDLQTCQSGTATLDFFIDGSKVGTEAITAGGSSRPYSTTAGPHVLGAEITNTRAIVWGPINVTLPAGTFTQVLGC